MSQLGWSVDEAKEKFDELLDDALSGEPQFIVQGDERAGVILSCELYTEMKSKRVKVGEFFRNSPLVGANLDLRRRKTCVFL